MKNMERINEIITRNAPLIDVHAPAEDTAFAIAYAVKREIETGRAIPRKMETVIDNVDLIVEVETPIAPNKQFVIRVDVLPRPTATNRNLAAHRFVKYVTVDNMVAA